MRNLPVFEAAVEIIQSLLLKTSNDVSQPLSIGVDIKAKRRLQKYETDCQVFYVRVCCSHGLDLEKAFEENEYRRFGELLVCMQQGEEEGHLSVTRACTGDTSGSEQRVFWLDQGPEGEITLSCRHSTIVSNIGSEQSPFTIHFRVIQQESHIVSEGHRIHKYLHKLKLLKEKLHLSFSMKVGGAVCQTDFSVKKYISVENSSIVDDIKHFFGKDCTRRLWCGSARVFSGETASVRECCGSSQCSTSSLQLSISSIVSFYPLVERYPETHGSFGVPGHIIINFFGPDEIALACTDDHFKSVDVSNFLKPEQFSLKLQDATEKIHGDLSLGATVTDPRYLPSWATHCTSFLLCVALVVSPHHTHPSATTAHEILKHLQDNPASLSCILKSAGVSISSCLKQIFVRRETEHEKLYRSTYAQCTEMVTSSICDIYNHSTDTNFRSQMMHLLQAEGKEDLRMNLKQKLCRVVKISDNLVCRSKDEDNFDVWGKGSERDSQHSHGDKANKDGPLTLNEDILLSQPSSSQLNTQPMIPTEASQPSRREAEEELLDEIEELNNFHQSIERQFSQPVLEYPASSHVEDNQFTEEDLTFFHNESELEEDVPVLEEHTREEGLQALMESHDLSNAIQPSATTKGQLTLNSPTGDEWLDDSMFDMSDWL